MILTQEEANEVFHHEKHTGFLLWKIKPRDGIQIGDRAGCKLTQKSGYRAIQVQFCGQRYVAARLIWLMQTGEWPDKIDHINGDATDNRWCNLRNVDTKANSMNVKIGKGNSSGIMGVHWSSAERKWKSSIGLNRDYIHLYGGPDFFEACCRRKVAEIELGFHPNHGRR